MNQTERELLEKSHLQHMIESSGRSPAERPTIHYTELAEDTSTSPIAAEWNFYRREAGRLLAEGHEGRWVLIKDEKIIGIWDTEQAAYDVALKDYLMQPVFIHQVLTREPVLRGPTFLRLCSARPAPCPWG